MAMAWGALMCPLPLSDHIVLASFEFVVSERASEAEGRGRHWLSPSRQMRSASGVPHLPAPACWLAGRLASLLACLPASRSTNTAAIFCLHDCLYGQRTLGALGSPERLAAKCVQVDVWAKEEWRSGGKACLPA